MQHRHPCLTTIVLCSLASCGGGGGEGASSEIDTTPPVAGTAADGLGSDVDTQTSTTTVAANWTGFTDDSGSIASYAWAIGTTPGGTELAGWTNVGPATQATN